MNHKGFTLVEILIVVIILGILAAIVIPQFTEASNDARTSSLTSDLQSLRAQIELYKMQHLDTLPSNAIVNQLTLKTNLAGAVGVTAAHKFGPYLQKFPSNPFVDTAPADTIEFADDGTTAAEDAAYAGSADSADPGWYYNHETGYITPNDADHVGL